MSGTSLNLGRSRHFGAFLSGSSLSLGRSRHFGGACVEKPVSAGRPARGLTKTLFGLMVLSAIFVIFTTHKSTPDNEPDIPAPVKTLFNI